MKKSSFRIMKQQYIKKASNLIHTFINTNLTIVIDPHEIYSTPLFPQKSLQTPSRICPLTDPFFLRVSVCDRQSPLYYQLLLARQNYNILRMQLQTLALPLTQKPSPQTLIAIMQEYAPKGLALREDRLLVLVDDPQTCALLMQKVKSGTYPELEREVFEILDSAANTATLLENSTGVFETAEQVRHFFQMAPQNAAFKQYPSIDEEEVKAELDSLVEEPVRISLLQSLYEPSCEIEVEFGQSVFQSMESPAPEPMERSEEFVNAYSHEVALEEEKEHTAENVGNTQEYSPANTLKTDNQVQKQKETADRAQFIVPPICPRHPISTSHVTSRAKPHAPTSAYLTAVLLLWICWLAV